MKQPITNEQMKQILEDQSSNYYLDMSEVDFSSIIEQNLNNKKRFYDKMNEQGRLTTPIELVQDNSSLDHLVSKFVRSLGITLYGFINKYFSFEEIIENRLTSDKDIEKYDLSFNKGMKFTKAISKLMEKMKYSMQQRERVINDYSLVLNEKKLKGLLVLSVNPIDFYTMSLSDSWSSCLSPGGEYESGTMGYAGDKNTVIAFLISSADEEKLNSNKYVNKKWRKLLIVSDTDSDGKPAILASRGYPYDGEMLTDEAVKNLSTLLFDINMIRYEYEKVYGKFSTVFTGPGYSDISIRNNIYIYSPIEDLQDKSIQEVGQTYFRFGSHFDCLHCNDDTAQAESFACMSCGNHDSCEDCGEFIARDGGYYTYYGYSVCEGCMEGSYAFASDTDELYHTSDLTWVDSLDDFVTDQYASKHCTECLECGNIFENNEMIPTEKGMMCEDCSEEVETVE